jgi:hypothetical protein
MRSGAAPLWEQLAFGLFAPPIMAVVLRLMMKGWATIVQGGTISETTRKRQRVLFWGVLILMYLIVFGEIIYPWMT